MEIFIFRISHWPTHPGGPASRFQKRETTAQSLKGAALAAGACPAGISWILGPSMGRGVRRVTPMKFLPCKRGHAPGLGIPKKA